MAAPSIRPRRRPGSVRRVGFEPTRPLGTADFESAASTVPPPPRGGVARGASRSASASVIPVHPETPETRHAEHPCSSFLATTTRGKLTLALLCAVAFLDFVDASIVNVALPSIRRDLHFSVAGPAVGAERLPADLRRLHAARRPRRRPARPPPRARRRARCCSAPRLARRRARRRRGRARRRPPRPGRRRGDDAARRALDPDHHVRGGQGPQHGARRLGRRRRPGVRRRRAARRRC